MKNHMLLAALVAAALAPAGVVSAQREDEPTPPPAASEDDVMPDEVLAVSPQDVARLWRRVAGSEIDLPGSAARYKAGCAAVSYVIEGNGTVSSVRMLHAYPRKEVGDAVAKWVGGWRLEPTAENFEKVPLYTIQIFNVFVKNADGTSGGVPDENELASHCAVTIVRRPGQ